MSPPLDRRTFVSAITAPLVAGAFPVVRGERRPSSPRPAIAPPSAAFLRGLPRQMEIAGVPAVGMAVVQEGRVVWQEVRGVADAGTGTSATATTLWPAASLSKPLFALGALRLVDDGALDLDRPLRSYVPGHAPDDARGDRITARHVLSHSSGLRNWRNRPEQPLVPDFEPGARFQYSGEGYYYLQRAVEHITGLGFGRFMEERVLGPLGMRESTYTWRADTAARVVTGHDRGQPQTNFNRDLALRLLAYAEEQGVPLASLTHERLVAAMQGMTPAPPTLPNNMLPNAAGSLLTTPAEYGTFLGALFGAGATMPAAVALRPATRRAMLTPQVRINAALGWGLGWGLAWQTAASDAGRDADTAWHWGDNGWWKNFVVAHPASGSALVVFTNGSRGMNVAQRIVAAATGEDHPAFLWL
jgi:CubicO group peptidase (beta-lactamase class C family)